MTGKMHLSRPEITGAAWLLARLWLGWQFLEAGWTKTFGDERSVWVGAQAGVAVRGFLEFSLKLAPGGELAGPHPEVTGWYATLIREAFLPNAVLFSHLVAVGELLVGLALIAGLATRFAVAMGLLMNLSYLLAGVSSVGPLMVMIEVPMLLGGATAAYYGLDHVLLPQLRASLVRLAPRLHLPVPAAPGV
jgi:thiosulfate dehydrogenase (quinone) large subunit